MNEVQHEANMALERARSQVKLKRHELCAARRAEYAALGTLREAVRRDPESWYGTSPTGEALGQSAPASLESAPGFKDKAV
jgi:hypothetical protein